MKLLDRILLRTPFFQKQPTCNCTLPKDTTKLRLECLDRQLLTANITQIRAFEHMECQRLLTPEQAKPLLRIGESQQE